MLTWQELFKAWLAVEGFKLAAAIAVIVAIFLVAVAQVTGGAVLGIFGEAGRRLSNAWADLVWRWGPPPKHWADREKWDKERAARRAK